MIELDQCLFGEDLEKQFNKEVGETLIIPSLTFPRGIH